MEAVQHILAENDARLRVINARFDPISGEGSVGERTRVVIKGLSPSVMFLPVSMMDVPLVRQLVEAGSVDRFIKDIGASADDRDSIIEQFIRVRIRHDFAFWAALTIYILSKEPGQGEILFRLTRPQRRFVARIEKMRLAGKPIRLILLKARQWGGSTTSQLYMAWLQLVHKKGLNSAIISQTKKTSFAIKAMLDRALEHYPLELLYRLGEAYNPKEPTMVNVGLTGDYKRIPQRDSTITVASYEAPDALRGEAYSLVHCSEVGLWSPTEKKSPESVVRAACSGILLKPYTMIIYESTANGTGNFFHREYQAAKEGRSQFEAFFVSWFDIDLYSLPFESKAKRKQFAQWLYDNRLNNVAASNREEPGTYLWWLWQKGATLEAIQWYIEERKKYTDHGLMASEYPSDDIEAFQHSGAKVFDLYQVESMRTTCRDPRYIGEVESTSKEAIGRDPGLALTNLRFRECREGLLYVRTLPEVDAAEKVEDRYLVVVDIGGRSGKADWSVITVFDRVDMMDGGKPSVVAQWRGHIDHDRLAWKAAQIARFYDDALLVIESNTLETKDKNRDVDGDQSTFILDLVKAEYDNLYARKQSPADIAEGLPRKYGFHTNVNTKPAIISWLITCVRDRLYVERDGRCLDEYTTYEKTQNGVYQALQGFHDDMLMTRAIGLHICFREMPLPSVHPRRTAARLSHKPVSAASI